MSFKLLVKEEQYLPEKRKYLIDILKPFIGKSEKFTDEERQELYGISINDIKFVNVWSDSELAVLPMSWNHYYENNTIREAVDFVKEAAKYNIKVISWVSGDFGVRVPELNNLYIFRQSGYRSKLNSHHYGLPAFIKDPLKRYYHQNEVRLRDKKEMPVVGFCGQAKTSKIKSLKDVIRTGVKNFKYNIKLSNFDPQTIYPSTLLRGRVLSNLEEDNDIQSNFIKRTKYRAGALTQEERHKTTLEFYDNMMESDYIVCVRGGGNFSVRFYEALSMGRIPLFLDTDCLLPMEGEINWGKHIVRIKSSNIDNVSDILKVYHKKLTPGEFSEIQVANRKLWNESLQLGPFWKRQLGDILKK